MVCHEPSVYRELLVEFRNGQAEHGQSLFCLEALSDEEERALSRGQKWSLIGKGGSIVLPRDSWWWVWAAVGGLIDCPNKGIYQKVLKLAKPAWECFEPLAARAGSHLPRAIRKAMPYEPADGESWWFNVLWWLQVPDEAESDPRSKAGGLCLCRPSRILHGRSRHAAWPETIPRCRSLFVSRAMKQATLASSIEWETPRAPWPSPVTRQPGQNARP